MDLCDVMLGRGVFCVCSVAGMLELLGRLGRRVVWLLLLRRDGALGGLVGECCGGVFLLDSM